ncbi:DUF732 domain-containing protein [Mycobacterium sp.]|uniref:DUF732 domain-containing protein n=1 Tax=Mycobacterium sp. TaxID=1785 RepID=UPI003F98768B
MYRIFDLNQVLPSAPTTTAQPAPDPSPPSTPSAADDVANYLQSLHDEGITGINGDDSLVAEGHNVCTDLEKGYTHLQEVNALLGANPEMDREGAMKVVTYANIFLCVNVDIYDTTIPPLAQQ